MVRYYKFTMNGGFAMALIKCVECGKEISCQAKSCPNCGLILTTKNRQEGYDLMKKMENKMGIGIYSVIFGIIFPIVGFILGIIGIVKKEKYSVYGIFISIIMPIFYLFLYIYIIGGVI